MTTGDLRAAIEYASQNPKSDFANQLNQRISSGQADQEAKQLGIDLTPIKSYVQKQNPVPPAPAEPTQTINQGKGSDVLSRIQSAPKVIPTVEQKGGEILGNLKDTFTSGASQVTDAIGNVRKNAEEAGGSSTDYALADLGAAGHIAGAIAGTAGGIIGSFVSPFLPQTVKDKIGDIGNHIQAKMDEMGIPPEVQKALADVFNTATLLGGEKITPVVKDAAITAAEKVATGAGAISKTASSMGDIINTGVNDAKDTIKSKAVAVKEAISPSLTPEEQVGKIIQGKVSDIPAAQRSFGALPSDISSISKMAPEEVSGTLGKQIQSNLDQVDTHYAGDTNLHPMSDFEMTTGKGANAVKTNYVSQAIDQLKEFYTKTNDASGLSDMKALEEKANTEGLSSHELNDLAKEHGATINAFNANGEAASGLSKQAAENTRSGVKTTARNTLAESDPNAASEVTRLDHETSDAIKTKDLMDKQVEKGAVKIQKTGKEGAISKAYNSKTGKIVRTAVKVGVGGEFIKKGLGL